MSERLDLAIEGKEAEDGRYIVPGALRWPKDEAVPVTLNTDKYEQSIVGKATDFQRSKEGVISARVVISEEVAVDLSKVSGTIAVSDAKWEEATATLRGGLIRNIHLSPDFGAQAWPALERLNPPPALAEVANAAREVVGTTCESHAEPQESCPTCTLLELLGRLP